MRKFLLMNGLKMSFVRGATLALLLVFLTGFSHGASLFGDQTRNFVIKNKSLQQAIEQILDKSGYYVVYAVDNIKSLGTVSAEYNNITTEEALKNVLSDKGLTFTVKDNNVVITKAAISAQQPKGLNIKGSVFSKNDKKPIAGATVIVEGTTKGAITDAKGQFALTGNVGEIMEISFTGMKPLKVTIVAAKTDYAITMEEDAMAVDDVVVTGYFNKSSNVFTGAVKTIKKEEIQKFGNAGVLNVLAMSDPSFKIKENINAGSDPNALPEFFVRGESSFMSDSNLPTFIVDGYEVSAQYVLDMDIDRIESLSILKDASATVFYGSRAANGVVVIETRRPAAGKLQVTYSNRTSLSIADLSDYNLMNAKEKLEYEVKAGLFIPSSIENSLVKEKEYQEIYNNVVRGVNTDWLSQPVRNPISHNHSLYISGGDNAITYALSGNYNKNVGVIKNSHRESFEVGFDLTYRIKDKINIKNSLTYSGSKSVNSPYGSFSEYSKVNPYERIYDDNGDYILAYGRHSTSDQYNPLYNASLRHIDESTNNTLINKLSIDYRITNSLRLIGSLALNKKISDAELFISPFDAKFENEKESNKRGSYKMNNGKGFAYDANVQLTYNLVADKHNFYAGIGFNAQDDKLKSHDFLASGFVDEDFYDIGFALGYDPSGKPSSVNTRSRLVGFLGNVNYSYDNRYFVDFAGRLDGSSKYGADNRFAALWSVGLGWNIHNESFMKGSKEWLEVLKLRGSIGITGNQNFDPTQARMTYKYYNEDLYYESIGVSYIKYGNKDLAWQQTLKKNIGLDFQFLQRKLSLTVNYYNDVTDGLLLPVTVAPSLGFSSYTENYGEQSNQGIEFDALVTIVRNNNFDLSISASGNHNKNKVTKISSALSALNEQENSKKENFKKPIAMYEEGESLSTIKAVRSLGINPETGKEIFLTRDGRTTEVWDYRDKINVGDGEAKLSGTIGLNVIYKQFSLSASLLYSFGGDAYNTTLAERVEGSDPKSNADKRVLGERWQKPGDVSFYKDIADRTVSNTTSRFVQKNNYVDMGNIALTYRFKREILKSIGMSNLKVSLNTNNVFHISSIKRERGLDYPFARQFTFSLNANF